MAVVYNVYANDGLGGPVDYSTPVASTSGLSHDTAALACPGEWRFAVRAEAGGLEELNADAAVRLLLDAGGADVSDLPPAPVGLSAWPIAGGLIRAAWAPGRPSSRAEAPAGYRVYVGVGAPDYGTAAATVPAGPASLHADLSGLADGTSYAIGVRAYNAAGEEANATAVTATADATGPDAVVGLAISTDPGDW